MTHQSLGRGLAGLMKSTTPGTIANHPAQPVTVAPVSPEIPTEPLKIPVSQIKTSPYQPRQVFDEAKLAELADSIGALGLVQPLVVRRIDATHYQLIAGERRLRAVTMLGWKEVPVSISNAAEDTLRAVALVENLQREDLNPIETSEALHELMENNNGLTHEQIAERIGKSRAWITNALRLLNLPKEVCQMIAAGEISGAHGRTLLGLPEPLQQINLAKRVAKEQIAVNKLEKLVQQMLGGKKHRKDRETAPDESRPAEKHLADTEKRLAQHLGAKVVIRDDHGKGKIEIDYYSYDEIAGILEKLGLTNE